MDNNNQSDEDDLNPHDDESLSGENGMENDESSDESKNETADEKTKKNTSYVGKKPKWWKKLGRRKGTKGQRNAINIMTQKGYVIPRLDKYLHVINVKKLVEMVPGIGTNNTSLSSEELLISRDEYDKQITPSKGLEGVEEDEGEVENDPSNRQEEKESKDDKIIHLEIGFGRGENLLTNAMMNPDEFYIGAEIHQPGVGVALNRMKHCLAHNNDGKIQFWREQEWFVDNDYNNEATDHSSSINHDKDDRIEAIMKDMEQNSTKPYDNLRIYPGDGVKILRFLPPSTIDNIYLTFPDPWPKKGNSQYRVIQEDTVNLIHDVLKPGGCFYLATDAVIFDEWTREIFGLVQKKNEERTGHAGWEELASCPQRNCWLPVLSKYEKKGIEEGRYTICRCWRSGTSK